MINEAEFRRQAQETGIKHIAIGAVVFNDQNQILLVRRTEGDFLGGYYEIPGGGVEDTETIIDSLHREILEETGLKVIEILESFEGFDYSEGDKRTRLINFIVRTDSFDITLNPKELDGFVWAGVDDYRDFLMTDEMRVCVGRAFNAIPSR